MLLPSVSLRLPCRHRPAVRSLAAAGIVLLAACGGDSPTGGGAAVASITFAVPSDTLSVGETVRFTVSLSDDDGRPLAGARVSWASSNRAVATITSNGTVTARGIGVAEIRASSGGRTATLRLVVSNAPVASLTFTSPPVELLTGDVVQLVAVPRDAAGNALSGRTVTFTSSNPAVAVVSPAGALAARTGGEVTITASAGGATATITVQVVAVPVATIDLLPFSLTIAVGGTGELFPVLRDANGSALPDRPVIYRTTNPAVATVATVTRDGVVRAVVQAIAVGSAGIEAEIEGMSTTAPVTVVPATAPPPTQGPTTVPPPPLPSGPGDGSYSIDVNFVGPTDPRATAVVGASVARWQGAITSDLPDVTVLIEAGACYSGQPEEEVTVDDLLILVRLVEIDGPSGVLARAGPCYIRTASLLPVIGVVELDSDDLDLNPTLMEAVLTHEIGHVLGIGTLWNARGLLHGAETNDPLFRGSTAQDAYRQLGGGSALPPVENSDGPGTGRGTRLVHWSESVFFNELMTGFINQGANQMSILTVASLRDLGYAVDLNAADPYTLPSSGAARANVAGGSGVPGLRIQEELIRPRYTVDRDGTTRRIAPGGPDGRPW